MSSSGDPEQAVTRSELAELVDAAVAKALSSRQGGPDSDGESYRYGARTFSFSSARGGSRKRLRMCTEGGCFLFFFYCRKHGDMYVKIRCRSPSAGHDAPARIPDGYPDREFGRDRLRSTTTCGTSAGVGNSIGPDGYRDPFACSVVYPLVFVASSPGEHIRGV